MGLDQTMIIAGVGCRRGVRASEVEAAIARALAECRLAVSALGLIASAEAKADEAGIVDAAAVLGARLVLVSEAALIEAGERVITKSERVQELFGVPSVAEAAVLAAGGTNTRLLAPRIVVGSVTCALGEAP
jgi:cobalt-precorrin 5A hydrolase